ncbi:FAD-dependent monooxygenase [Paenibacillus yanchengensis]|uniref:FAD-dependent monooxygenase n=1 Tax=Paenibacillus yanchengensis TaxID=2035833 RepID=A0ABW4YJY2_9BACL
MKKVLIVGLGIAGMSAAISLKNIGWEPVIIERASERRRGGYFIGLFPEGIKAAQKLGSYEEIKIRTPDDSIENFEMNKKGKMKRGISFSDQPGNPQSTLRGDIEEGLWQTVDQSIKIIYSTVPIEIKQKDQVVNVKLKNILTDVVQTESYDLVIGADGLRSTVRSLVFGSHDKYMKSLNTMIVAFQMKKDLPVLINQQSITLVEKNRSVWFFGLKDTNPTVLFTYRTKDIDSQFIYPIKDVLKDKYKGMTGENFVNHALSELEKAENPLTDSVHQVIMPKWSKGNVVMLGDSAWCLTLYSGMGASAGMMGANVLGEKLSQSPEDIQTALENYESELRPFINKHQKLAFLKSQFFVPSNLFYGFLRSRIIKMKAKQKFKN